MLSGWMSKGLLRNKIPELRLALEGRMTEHHRFLLRQLYDHLRFTESKRSEIEQEIENKPGRECTAREASSSECLAWHFPC